MRKTFKLFGRYFEVSINVYRYSNQYLHNPNSEVYYETMKEINRYYLKEFEKSCMPFEKFNKICELNQAEIVKWKKTPEPLSGEIGEIPSFKNLNSTKWIPNPKTGKPYTDKEYEDATHGTYIPVEEELKGKWKP